MHCKHFPCTVCKLWQDVIITFQDHSAFPRLEGWVFGFVLALRVESVLTPLLQAYRCSYNSGTAMLAGRVRSYCGGFIGYLWHHRSSRCCRIRTKILRTADCRDLGSSSSSWWTGVVYWRSSVRLASHTWDSESLAPLRTPSAYL